MSRDFVAITSPICSSQQFKFLNVGKQHWCGFSEEYLEKLKNSDVQYYALAYACYKVATPARYTVTVGGTTWSIFYLEKWGMLKTTTQVAEGMR